MADYGNPWSPSPLERDLIDGVHFKNTSLTGYRECQLCCCVVHWANRARHAKWHNTSPEDRQKVADVAVHAERERLLARQANVTAGLRDLLKTLEDPL
jgi:hypothetical protein